MDAEKLARYARLDPEILRPIAHRTVEQQEALTLIRARNLIVRLRTAAVNAVRGLTKACNTYLRSLLIELRQPHPPTAWTRLFASTVGPAAGFTRRQAGQE